MAQSAKLVIIISYSASVGGIIVSVFQGVAPPSFNNKGLTFNKSYLVSWLSFKQTIRTFIKHCQGINKTINQLWDAF